tara:strand:+ start:857 stop:1930 length:1074 start_codon:yes stop_codon:yes gene_type:complete
MKVYKIFLISNFIKSFLYVFAVILSLVFILNVLTEIEFFNEYNVKFYFPIYVSILNSPSLIFEIFPFIFMICTQVFFINLFNNNQIQIFKYTGLKNSYIMSVLIFISFFLGIIIIALFYNVSSNLKNIYLKIKNKYTSNDNYLAVITKNGLWIKDTNDNRTSIIHASKINGTYLINTFITEFDNEFKVIRHIQSPKVNIKYNNWVAKEVKVYQDNNNFNKNILEINSNFNYEKIQGMFSNLSSLSIYELYELKKNYKSLSYSTTEVNLQLYKIISFPVYLMLMTILSSIIMFNTRSLKSSTLKICVGLFLSVLIYYMNNFFYVMGKTERISVLISILLPLFVLITINCFMILKINEK